MIRTSTRRPGFPSKVGKPTPKSAVQDPQSELAERLSNLTISKEDKKGKKKEHNNAPGLEERRKEAMRAVDMAAQRLSGYVKSGWKANRTSATKGTISSETSTIFSLASDSIFNLAELRKLSTHDVNVERAACSLVGKLLALELDTLALTALSDMHPRLCAILEVDTPAVALPTRLKGSPAPAKFTGQQFHLLSIPLPLDPSKVTDLTLLTLLTTYMLHVSMAVSRPVSLCDALSIDKFSRQLASSSSTLLSWIRSGYTTILPAKHIDSILTRVYSILIKAIASSSSAPPETLFSIRTYALHCLLLTSPGTVEPSTFWNQAVKVCAAFVKAAPTHDSAENQMVTTVLATFEEFISAAEKRDDRRQFMDGKGFISFCDCWTSFAKQASSLHTLDRIAILMGSSQSASDETNPKSSPSNPTLSPGSSSKENPSPDRRAREVAQIMTTIAQATVALETSSETGSGATIDSDVCCRVKTAISAGSTLVSILREGVGGVKVLVDPKKVDRIVDKLRRVAIRTIDINVEKSVESGEDVRRCIVDLLGIVVDILVERFRHNNDIVSILDCLFVLARVTLRTTLTDSHDASYRLLERAKSLLSERAEVLTAVDRSNYIRCTSAAFHHAGGVLYQAERFGSAIRFLRDACELGVQAILLRKDVMVDAKEDEKELEAWRTLEGQVFRRWELLGVCYTKIGDRQKALQAFLECVRSFNFAGLDFSKPNTVLFNSSTPLKQLGSIIDKATYLGACDLFEPPEAISLKCRLPEQHSEVVAALIERQIDSLEDSFWKDNVKKVVKVFIQDALDLYQQDTMPVRRIRLLAKSLEFFYFAGPEYGLDPQCSMDEISRSLSELESRQNFGIDEGLSLFRFQYLISGHLWLGLHAHRSQDVHRTRIIDSHIGEACRILKSAMPLVSSSSPDKKSPRRLPGPLKKPAGRTAPKSRTVAARSKLVTKSKAPITPKPQTVIEPLPMNGIHKKLSSRLSESTKFLVQFDRVDKLLALLQLSSELLGLVGLTPGKIRLLDFIRRLCQSQQAFHNEYVVASVDLAQEYVKLGKDSKASLIFGQALHAVRNMPVSHEIRTVCLLRYAGSLADGENILRSSAIYCEALSASQAISNEEKGLTTLQRVARRVGRLEQAAIAAQSFASIQNAREDATASIAGLLQSLRLWTRSIDVLARLNPSPSPAPSSEEPDPFAAPISQSTSGDDAAAVSPDKSGSQRKIVKRLPSMNGLEWRVASGSLSIMFLLVNAYVLRGSVREAEYFVQQALDLAESLDLPIVASHAIMRRAEIQLNQGKLEEAHGNLQKAVGMTEGAVGVDMADAHRLLGDFNQRAEKYEDAVHLYKSASAALEELRQTFAALDVATTGPRKSTGLSPKASRPSIDFIAPPILSAVLREHVWLLRNDAGDEYRVLLERFLSLPSSFATKSEENALMAKLTLHDIYARFSGDMFFSSIAESTISLPMVMTTDKPPSVSPSAQEIVAALSNAQRLFALTMAAVAKRGKATVLREAAISLALVKALQTSIGGADKEGPVIAATLLDAQNAVTLRREMLDAIDHKFLDIRTLNDLQWPLITPSGAPLPRPAPTKPSPRDVFDSEDEDDVPFTDETGLKAYWDGVRRRYESFSPDLASLSSSTLVDTLPETWTVVSISVAPDKSSLLVSRQAPRRPPLVFCVPLRGRREGEAEEEHLAFDDAIRELEEIIRSSNESTKRAVGVRSDDAQARAAWWAERAALDKRLKDLLENIEFCWLGAFKTILSPLRTTPTDVLADLRTRFDNVFARFSPDIAPPKPKSRSKQHQQQHSHSAGTGVHLHDALLECFSALPPSCRDEELEDVVCFVLDLAQVRGTAAGDADVDTLAAGLRSALEEHASVAKRRVQVQEGGHMFLVLDRNVQGIPWESIPILRGRSVSRIPSVEFLVDRLEFAKLRRGDGRGEGEVDRAEVDPRQTYYFLNPSGDLKGTEGRFSGWLNDMKAEGWQGLIGRVPSEQQFLDALARNDLVIYLGHGGGEQYVRSHRIRHLPRCAATMLWGCSSGALREMGDFDRVGTPYNYMLSGCPTLVANLWDVTDRDIDKFSQSVFDKLGLTPPEVRQWKPASRDAASADGRNKSSIVAAIAESRTVCKLKYLTGAAPVVYGIPFYL